MMCSFNNAFAFVCALCTPLMTGSLKPGVHVELYVRSLAPRGLQEGQRVVLETIESLKRSGTLTDHTLYVSGAEIPATPAETVTDFGKFLLNRAAVFSAWADKNDVSLGKLFERRSIHSSITGEHRETLVFPVMALAEYEGTDLRFVAPCTVDGTSVTVRDRLDELRAGTEIETVCLPDAHASPPNPSQPLVQ